MWRLPLIVACSYVLGLGGCAAAGPVSSLVSTPAHAVDCHYVRVDLDYTLDCSMEGRLEGLELAPRGWFP